MGVDSRVQESNKLYFADYLPHYTNRMHLHYQNMVPNGQTNFIPWSQFLSLPMRLIGCCGRAWTGSC